MDCISHSTVLEYSYNSELSMKIHEDQMRKDGWFVSSTKQYIWSKNEFYREYRKRLKEGVYF